MNAHVRLPVQARSFEVRSFDGARQAVSRPFEAGQQIEIGYELDCDVVVRDRRAQGCRLSLLVEGDAAKVQLKAGEVGLLGHKVAAPAELRLPPFMPLDLGGLLIGYGECGVPEWERAEALVEICRRAPGSSHPQAAAPASPVGDAGFGSKRRLAALAGLAALVLVGVVGWSTVALNPPFQRSAPQKTAAEIVAAGRFEGLTVRSSKEGAPVISGVLPTDAAALRLRSTLNAEGVEAKIEVTTSEAIARQVEDVFRSGAVQATARAVGGRRIAVALPPATLPWTADALLRRARSALPETYAVEISTTPHQLATNSQVMSDGAVFITEVSSGESGFVATSDGSIYFAGARLPTGQRLVSISASSLTLEMSNIVTQIDL